MISYCQVCNISDWLFKKKDPKKLRVHWVLKCLKCFIWSMRMDGWMDFTVMRLRDAKLKNEVIFMGYPHILNYMFYYSSRDPYTVCLHLKECFSKWPIWDILFWREKLQKTNQWAQSYSPPYICWLTWTVDKHIYIFLSVMPNNINISGCLFFIIAIQDWEKPEEKKEWDEPALLFAPSGSGFWWCPSFQLSSNMQKLRAWNMFLWKE